MKFSQKLLAVAVATSALLTIGSAEPCAEDDGICIKEDKPCTGREDECCPGTFCHGYNFFKKCVSEPSCIEEMWACDPDGMGCCDDMICETTHSGLHECRPPTPISNRTTTIPGFEICEPPPVVLPPPINLKTTKITPVHTKKAVTWGDPHVNSFDGIDW